MIQQGSNKNFFSSPVLWWTLSMNEYVFQGQSALLLFSWTKVQHLCFSTMPTPIFSKVKLSAQMSLDWPEPWPMPGLQSYLPLSSSLLLLPRASVCPPPTPCTRHLCISAFLNTGVCSVTSSLTPRNSQTMSSNHDFFLFPLKTMPWSQMKPSLPSFPGYPNGCWFQCYFFLSDVKGRESSSFHWLHYIFYSTKQLLNSNLCEEWPISFASYRMGHLWTFL